MLQQMVVLDSFSPTCPEVRPDPRRPNNCSGCEDPAVAGHKKNPQPVEAGGFTRTIYCIILPCCNRILWRLLPE